MLRSFIWITYLQLIVSSDKICSFLTIFSRSPVSLKSLICFAFFQFLFYHFVSLLSVRRLFSIFDAFVETSDVLFKYSLGNSSINSIYLLSFIWWTLSFCLRRFKWKSPGWDKRNPSTFQQSFFPRVQLIQFYWMETLVVIKTCTKSL